jgi:slit protein 2
MIFKNFEWPYSAPLLLLTVFLAKTTISGQSCPKECVCSSLNLVICTGQSLTNVPTGLPRETVRLDLQENRIATIRRDDFKNLPNLRILQLMDNELTTIEAGAFDNLTNLERM